MLTSGTIQVVKPSLAASAIRCSTMETPRTSKNRAIDARTIAFGEIGLSGEVRGVSMVEQRAAEAAKLSYCGTQAPGFPAEWDGFPPWNRIPPTRWHPPAYRSTVLYFEGDRHASYRILQVHIGITVRHLQIQPLFQDGHQQVEYDKNVTRFCKNLIFVNFYISKVTFLW